MNIKHSIRFIIIALIIVCSGLSFTKEKRARSYDSFYDQLAKSPYAVVLFYDAGKDMLRDNKQLKQMIEELRLLFRSLSKDPEYNDADLLFLTADIARRDLQAVVRGLHIEQLPTVQLFIGRQPIDGARLQGTIERAELDSLINRFLRKKIDEYLKEKDAARKRALERAQIRAYNRAYWGPYWYGYPYYYGPYGGYYGPGYGFYARW